MAKRLYYALTQIGVSFSEIAFHHGAAGLLSIFCPSSRIFYEKIIERKQDLRSLEGRKHIATSPLFQLDSGCSAARPRFYASIKEDCGDLPFQICVAGFKQE